MLNTTSNNNWDILGPCNLFAFFFFFCLSYVVFSLIRKIEIFAEIILCALHTHIMSGSILHKDAVLEQNTSYHHISIFSYFENML